MALLVASSGGGAVAGVIFGLIALVVVVLVLLKSILIVVPEYERGVFFRLGRILQGAKGPGIIVRIPGVDRVVKVNLRVEVVDIPPQAVITKDNVTIQVDAVVYFQVVDPVRAIVGVDNFRFASQRVAMTSLRSIIGRFELDDLLAHRDQLNAELRQVIDASVEVWGVAVRQVEVRDIQLPPELLRAMARQAEAEREKRAKIINAEGESLAAAALGEASDTMMAHPLALQLRNLQSLVEIGVDKNTTVVFPAPLMSTIEELVDFLTREDNAACGKAPAIRG